MATTQPKSNTNSVTNATVVTTLSISTKDMIIETVYNPTTGKAKLIIYNKDGDIQELSVYTIGGNTYRPLIDDDVIDGRLPLPSSYEPIGDLRQLLLDIQMFIHKYVDIDPRDELIASLYVMMTWVYDRFKKIPYLRIMGSYGTGKSRFLDVMHALCYHCTRLGEGATPANIYRRLKNYPGTLLLDEANYDYTNSSNMFVKILNGGNDRDGIVYRSDPGRKGYEQRSFNSYGPKILAAHGPYDNDGLESRFLSISSYETTRTDIPGYTERSRDWDEAICLRNRLLGFRLKYFFQINPGSHISGFPINEPRLKEMIKPLVQILCENELSNDMKEYVVLKNKEHIDYLLMGDDGLVAQAVLQLHERGANRPFFVRNVAEIVNEKRKGQYPLSDKKVGYLLKQLGFYTKHTRNGYQVFITRKGIDFTTRRFGLCWDNDQPEGEPMPTR